MRRRLLWMRLSLGVSSLSRPESLDVRMCGDGVAEDGKNGEGYFCIDIEALDLDELFDEGEVVGGDCPVNWEAVVFVSAEGEFRVRLGWLGRGGDGVEGVVLDF